MYGKSYAGASASRFERRPVVTKAGEHTTEKCAKLLLFYHRLRFRFPIAAVMKSA
jgi:hypothetical protein